MWFLLGDQDNEDKSDDENSEQNEAYSAIILKHSDVVNILCQVKDFACAKDNNLLLDKVMDCINVVQEDFLTKKTKQSTITQFFSKCTL